MLSNQAKIESLLFISGNEGITLTELSQITGILKPALHEQLDKLADKYKQDPQVCNLFMQKNDISW